jgi:hypothetical protein
MCPNVSINEIQVLGPHGLLSSPAASLTGLTDQWFSDISLTMDPNYSKGDLICTIASDTNGHSSLFSCAFVYVASIYLLNSTAKPTGIINTNNSISFQISFNDLVKRPSNNAYIHIYNLNGTEVAMLKVNNATNVFFNNDLKTISFNFPPCSFAPGSYYITFDQGVGQL